MSLVYPHLSSADADAALRSLERVLAEGRAAEPFPDGGLHPRTRFSGTGAQVTAGRLRELRTAVLSAPRQAGSVSGADGARRADIAVGAALDAWFGSDGRGQASRLEIWPYLSLVVLPDLVVERFGPDPDGRLKPERFLAGRRNALYRAYLRVWILGPLLQDQSLALYEDELVGVVDRNLSADHRIARVVAEHIGGMSGPGNRREIVREALKALQYELRVTDLGLLSDYDLRVQIGRMFQAAQTIKSHDDHRSG